MQTQSTLLTSEKDHVARNLVKHRHDPFDISSSEQSQQSFGLSRSHLGLRLSTQKKFLPAAKQTQSLDQVVIRARDAPSRLEVIHPKPKEAKGQQESSDATASLQHKEKAAQREIKQPPPKEPLIPHPGPTQDPN